MKLKSFQQSYKHSRNEFTLHGHTHPLGLGVARDPDLETIFGFSDWHLTHTASGLRLTTLSYPIPTLNIGRLALEVLLELSREFDWHSLSYANRQSKHDLPDFEHAQQAIDAINEILHEADSNAKTLTDRLTALRSTPTGASG